MYFLRVFELTLGDGIHDVTFDLTGEIKKHWGYLALFGLASIQNIPGKQNIEGKSRKIVNSGLGEFFWWSYSLLVSVFENL